MKIILLSGKAGAGKDTVADYIVRTKNYIKLPIADALKEHTASKYNFDINLCYSQEGKVSKISNGLSVRDLLIDESNIMKMENPNIWINYVIDKIKSIQLNFNNNYIISDWRYENEYNELVNAFPSNDIITYRINNLNNTVTVNNPNDSSETELDNFPFDEIIENDGINLIDLYVQIENIID